MHKLPIVAVIILLLSGHALSADLRESSSPTVTVTFQDGREITGRVDRRTSDDVLWLRVEREKIVLTTGFTWDIITQIIAAERRYTPAEFQSLANQFASDGPVTTSGSLTILAPRQSAERRDNKIVSVSVEATVANWDRDAESDGIELLIRPRSESGQVVPIDGAVSVDLVARSGNPDRSHEFSTLERWSHRIQVPDFTSSVGGTVRLSFREIQPEHNLAIPSFGMVNVRVVVNGQGQFDTSAPVRLRSYNPVRDAIEEHGQRHNSFGRYRGRHW